LARLDGRVATDDVRRSAAGNCHGTAVRRGRRSPDAGVGTALDGTTAAGGARSHAGYATSSSTGAVSSTGASLTRDHTR
jgi:hypothetical protein